MSTKYEEPPLTKHDREWKEILGHAGLPATEPNRLAVCDIGEGRDTPDAALILAALTDEQADELRASYTRCIDSMREALAPLARYRVIGAFEF